MGSMKDTFPGVQLIIEVTSGTVGLKVTHSKTGGVVTWNSIKTDAYVSQKQVTAVVLAPMKGALQSNPS